MRRKIAPSTAKQDTQRVLRNGAWSAEKPLLPGWAELLAAVPIKRSQNVEIFGEGQPVEYLYKVVDGAVRTFKVLSDGRRQITGFFLSGEFFGLETGNEHTLSAEAITNSKILSIKRSVLAVLAEHDKEIERRRLELAACELKRAQTHATVLILNAKERVAKFLLEMASRNPKGTKIELPMARLDIADYLGLTVETVSRVLGDLEAANIIARPTARHVVLRDRGKLSPTA
jgi:CRP/FNR family nitrogen fixation transcriptional regulator